MTRKHRATERLSPDQSLALLGKTEAHLRKILARLHRIAPHPADAKVLDIGAAQGLLLICCAKMGLQPAGVEPWTSARQVAQQLAEREGVEITILPGSAESLPFPDDQFHIVHANSVIEHVRDPQQVFNEVHRVLKPGGAFWFSAASSLCPRQFEIALFPCFSWYPESLKHRIMRWAQTHKPHLIGNTATPAMHWFTPRKVNRMLRKGGFQRIYDRWDLRLESEGGKLHALALRMIKTSRITKLLADILVPASSYAAVK